MKTSLEGFNPSTADPETPHSSTLSTSHLDDTRSAVKAATSLTTNSRRLMSTSLLLGSIASACIPFNLPLGPKTAATQCETKNEPVPIEQVMRSNAEVNECPVQVRATLAARQSSILRIMYAETSKQYFDVKGKTSQDQIFIVVAPTSISLPNSLEPGTELILTGRVQKDHRIPQENQTIFAAESIEIITQDNNTEKNDEQKNIDPSATAEKKNMVHITSEIEPKTPEAENLYNLYRKKGTVAAWLEYLQKYPNSPFAAIAQEKLNNKSKKSVTFSGFRPTGYRECNPQKVGVSQSFVLRHKRLLLTGKPWTGRCPEGERFSYTFTNPSTTNILLTIQAGSATKQLIVPPKKTTSGAAKSTGCRPTGQPQIRAGAKGPVLTFPECYRSFDTKLAVVADNEATEANKLLKAKSLNVEDVVAFARKYPTTETTIAIVERFLDLSRENLKLLQSRVKLNIKAGKAQGEVAPTPYTVTISNRANQDILATVRLDDGSIVTWNIAARGSKNEDLMSQPGKQPSFKIMLIRPKASPVPLSEEYGLHALKRGTRDRILLVHNGENGIALMMQDHNRRFEEWEKVYQYDVKIEQNSLTMTPTSVRFRTAEERNAGEKLSASSQKMEVVESSGENHWGWKLKQDKTDWAKHWRK